MKENKNLEYKEKVTNTFLKTVSAFANYGEGKIVFGIKDNGETVGLNNLSDTCLKPKPDFSFSINQNKKVLTLYVKEGLHKPYLYKGKAYKRNDTATVEIDQIELKRAK